MGADIHFLIILIIMFIATNQIWETPHCCKKDVHPRRTERVINALYGSKDDCCQLAF